MQYLQSCRHALARKAGNVQQLLWKELMCHCLRTKRKVAGSHNGGSEKGGSLLDTGLKLCWITSGQAFRNEKDVGFYLQEEVLHCESQELN